VAHPLIPSRRKVDPFLRWCRMNGNLRQHGDEPERVRVRPIWIDGNIFQSKRHAIKALKISDLTLSKMLGDGRAKYG